MELCCGRLLIEWISSLHHHSAVTHTGPSNHIVTYSNGEFYILTDDYIDWNVKWFVNNTVLMIRVERFCTVIVSTQIYASVDPVKESELQSQMCECWFVFLYTPCILLMHQLLCFHALLKSFVIFSVCKYIMDIKIYSTCIWIEYFKICMVYEYKNLSVELISPS
jgi:hypothetical protein